jgi:RNA polymerase sigma-70 factor, ECF subfamily
MRRVNDCRRFEATALPHLPALYRFARQLTDETSAQDLVQEAYVRGWKYFHSFKAETDCRAWLFRIIHNVWRDAMRSRRLEIPLNENEESRIEPYYDWEDEFLRDQFSPVTEQALSQVPENYRVAMLLADVEEFSYQEIAEIMACPIGTVMSRVNRGRRTLARLLRDSHSSSGKEVQPTERDSSEVH